MLRMLSCLLIAALLLAGCAAPEPVGRSSAPATLAPPPSSLPTATSISTPTRLNPSAAPTAPPSQPPAPHVLFVADDGAGNAALTIMDQGRRRTLLTAPDHGEIKYSVSPDYRYVAVVLPLPNRRARVDVMNLDGSGTITLTADLAWEGLAAWSPDGRTLAFVSTADPNAQCIQSTCYFDIFTINADGTNRRQLTTDPDADRLPVWSPDGTRIAFFRGCVDRAREICTPTLYVMHADGSNQTMVTDATGAPIQVRYDTPAPIWSGDGQELIVYLYRNGEHGAYRIPAAGGTPVKVYSFISTQVPNAVEEYGFRPSPDAKQVIFIRQTGECQVDSCTHHIYVMNADGSDKRQLTHDGTYNEEPAWSPDGKQILFVSDRESTDGNRTWGMYTMDADGGHQQQLAQNVDGSAQPLWLP
jgi:Tol biopolymer transport system component